MHHAYRILRTAATNATVRISQASLVTTRGKQLKQQLHHCVADALPCDVMPQIATKAGTLSAPLWTEAGQVWANNHPEIPQRECTCDAQPNSVCYAACNE